MANSKAQPWLNWGIECLWLLAAFLVPIDFFSQESTQSEAAIAYVEVPKAALLQPLAGLMAALWLGD